MVTTTGEVTRPTHGPPARVELTATITVGSAKRTKVFHLRVLPLPKAEPKKGYAFAYFTGEGTANGEQIYFAASKGNDPLHWDELNNGEPKLTSSLGDKGVRDPFIIRSPEGDKFYLIATDLKIYGNGDWDASQRTGSKSIMVWESTDLVNWSDQRMVQVSPETAGNTWAPEAFYDKSIGAYVVFWASKLYDESDTEHSGSTYNRMMYATTRDFRTFTPAKVWIDPGYSVIDSTVIENNGELYRFTKDERNNTSSTPCSKFIVEEKSTELRSTDWDFVAECIGKATDDNPGIRQGEGPTIFKSNTEEKWYLFIDEFGGRGYVPFESTDLDSGKWKISEDYQLPSRPRHGTVLPVTQAELDRLKAPPPPLKADKDGLVARYPMDQTGGTVAKDSSGHGYDGALSGDVTLGGGQATFGGTNGHVKLPGQRDGRDERDHGVGAGLHRPEPGHAVLAVGAGQQHRRRRQRLPVHHGRRVPDVDLQVRLERGAVRLRAPGQPRWLAHADVQPRRQRRHGGAVLRRCRGVAQDRRHDQARRHRQRQDDGQLPGPVALQRRQVLQGEDARRADLQPRAAEGQGREPAGQLDVRALGEAQGAQDQGDHRRRQQHHHAARRPGHRPQEAGAGVRPGGQGPDRTEERRDRRPQQAGHLHVTGEDRATRTWTVKAVEMRSPVLPGYNADPNIIVFGDTYYIYATTDGFAGWASTTFSAWSSKDLVNWTNEGKILDLGPDVSWADGRAWAPTITEKNGKYYFYFCADTNIGVAVSDSPTGPFTDSGAPLAKAGSRPGQQIDPAVFTDDDGTSYLYWGNGTAYVVPLNEDMVSFDESKVRTIPGSPTSARACS